MVARVQLHRQSSELPTDVGLMIAGFIEGFHSNINGLKLGAYAATSLIIIKYS